MSTEISWTDETWNPTTGCSKVSEGCRNCYAAKLAPRLAAMGQKGYTKLPWTARNAPENVVVHPDRLEKPLHWRKPRRVFVNSMSDLFHEQVPDEFIDKVFAVMSLAPQHTFQILTKRPERMAEYLKDSTRFDNWQHRIEETAFDLQGDSGNYPIIEPPLHNVWCGTSVEDQRAADERIPHLLKTPAAVRFLSCEPLIGPVDLLPYLVCDMCKTTHKFGPCSRNVNRVGRGPLSYRRIEWVIAGGESGPGYRPMDLDWMRDIKDQCQAAGVAFFGKQPSGFRNEMPLPEDLQIREFPEVAR